MKAFKKCWEEFSDLKILFCVFTFYSLSFFLFSLNLELGIPGVDSDSWSLWNLSFLIGEMERVEGGFGG